MNLDFAQGLPATSIPPSPTERSGLGAEPTPSRSPRTRRAAHVSPKSPPPSPKLRGILQASSSPELCITGCDPRAASTLALDRPGPRGGAAGTRPARSQGCPSLTPSLGRRVRAHNIRPASRLRRPSGVKLSAAAHAHRPATGLRQGAPSAPPPAARLFPAPDWPDRPTAEPACAAGAPRPTMSGRSVLTGSPRPPTPTPARTRRPGLDIPKGRLKASPVRVPASSYPHIHSGQTRALAHLPQDGTSGGAEASSPDSTLRGVG